jgi:hypothetical protein
MHNISNLFYFGTTLYTNFMVAPCINNIKHFIFQLMHTSCKILRLLKYRVPQKRELLKNPTKIEEIQEKKFIDRH